MNYFPGWKGPRADNVYLAKYGENPIFNVSSGSTVWLSIILSEVLAGDSLKLKKDSHFEHLARYYK